MNSLSDNVFSVASQTLVDYLYHYHHATDSPERFFTSNNLALSAELFRAVGGFNSNMPLPAGEDRELCDRWLSHGYSLTYAPEAIVYHAHYLNLASFLRQHFNYGRGAFHFHLSRVRRNRKQVKPEHHFFYLKLVSYPFSRAAGHHAPLLSMLLVMSQVATAIGFIAEWKKQRKKKAPL